VRLDAVELVRVRLPLVEPFASSAGVERERDALLVHVVGEGVEGWGEDVAQAAPTYAAEFVDASHLALRHHLVPLLLDSPVVAADDVAARLAPVRGWSMAKCALEAAVLDAECRRRRTRLQDRLGGRGARVAAGVAIGLHPTAGETVATVRRYLAAGYRRVKLKIEPGRDIEVVRAVREAVGPDVPLQVDANAAYTIDDADHLAELDGFDLLLVEQPLAEDDLLQHAELAARLRTPVCLDESITSARIAADAIRLGACSVVNVKPGRVGGYLEAVRVHDVCVAAGVPAWVGGMLETGVGRAANLALATLPGFTLLPDLSASDRYYRKDVTEPFVLHDGCLAVPVGPGIGVAPDPAVLARLGATVDRLEA
jgi:O-succinylbenzoate synthase